MHIRFEGTNTTFWFLQIRCNLSVLNITRADLNNFFILLYRRNLDLFARTISLNHYIKSEKKKTLIKCKRSKIGDFKTRTKERPKLFGAQLFGNVTSSIFFVAHLKRSFRALCGHHPMIPITDHSHCSHSPSLKFHSLCIFQGFYHLNDRFSLLNCLLCLLLAEWVHSGLVFWVFLVMGFYVNDVQRTESSVLSFVVGFVFVGCSWCHYSSLHEFIFHVSH